MKKALLLLPLLTLVLFSSARVIEKTYHFNHYSITRSGDYDKIHFEGLLLSGKAGEPALPYLPVKIALPPGEIVETIEVIPNGLTDIPGKINLYPMQHSQPLSSDKTNEFIVDVNIYHSSQKFPQSLTGEISTYFLKGASIGMTSLTPVVYYPKEKRISYYSSITLKIHTRKSDQAVSALKNLKINKEDVVFLKKFVDNPQVINQYPLVKFTQGDYNILIITGSQYFSAFEPLEHLYLRRGLRSQLVDVNTINQQMTGLDLQEKIRNYIIQEYQGHGISYVVLGGDVNIIPARGFYCHVQSSSVYEDWNIPADLYYSALDGNWDNNGNQVWAEIGEDDLLPEVSVGRLPFNNLQEAQILINKSISYQDTPVVPELNKVLLLGEKLWENPETWGEDYLDLLIGNKMDNGYNTNGIYTTADIEKLYDKDLPQPWTSQQFLNTLSEGAPAIYHSGHASTQYNLRLFSWDLNDNMFSAMNGTEHNYGVIYSHGCYAGAFDDDCIAEDMLKLNTFAVEYIGNSRFGWFNEGQTEGPSEHLNREFVNALYHQQDYRIGFTHLKSKIASSGWVNAPGQWEEGALRWCYYCCNVLGDPVLGIWTDIPVAMQITCPPAVQAFSTQMSVHVNDGIGAVEGVTCAFLKGNQLYGAAVTDNTGTAVIQFDEIPVTTGQGEVVVSGYNRLATATPVSITGTVGITDISEYQEISVYPNPAAENIQLLFNSKESGSMDITLYSINGKAVGSKENIKYLSGINTFDFSGLIKDLPAGIYTLTVKTSKTARAFKIIKS